MNPVASIESALRRLSPVELLALHGVAHLLPEGANRGAWSKCAGLAAWFDEAVGAQCDGSELVDPLECVPIEQRQASVAALAGIEAMLAGGDNANLALSALMAATRLRLEQTERTT